MVQNLKKQLIDNRWFLITLFVTILLDQISKAIVLSKMTLGQSIPIVHGIFHFTFVKNTGAGFSILQNMNGILIWFTFIIIGILLMNYTSIEKKMLPIVGLLIGGAIGNLIDRIAHAGVIDFFDFRIWPVFNIADSAITVSGIILVIYFMKQK